MNVLESMQNYVEGNLSLLISVEQSWQPTDYLPDLTGDDWSENLKRFRQEALCLPDDLLVVLVGNMITEEALPNYAISLERVARDPTGTTDTPWAVWLRGWTAEENRHGDLLNAYLRLTGRVDMRAVEVTTQNLIRNGFSSGHEGDPYSGLIYASFQERATRLSHGNLARLASARGEANLAKICRKIAADEARHEIFYTRAVNELFDRDPEGAILAYRTTLKKLVAMPGSRMDDGRGPGLFDHYTATVQRTGVYTSRDYAAIIRHLNTAWGLENRSFSGKAAKIQDYLCLQPERYERLASEIESRAVGQPPFPFSWVHDRSA
ncbi:acyl-ACP desaturase [Paludisphaera mucosa]|uniref:Acyl-ACP desaturase n=1 Tax=Paludisphaera mucosa TaxID=3030827 RepID=A0ABT6F764_9BACT|nr:acyl-ACP desaturase [Paludisphaera mucosa]MDG3003435.1 acyl-ACP desaturase [Paludisphaera mucosa]